jgi:uncharacterized protein (DUF885 family)
MIRRITRRDLLCAGTLLLAAPAFPAPAPARSESERLNAFFEQVFQRNLARSPMAQSRLGIRTQQDKWDDIGERRQLEDIALVRSDLEALHRFDRTKLDKDAQLSYRLFERRCTEQLRGFEWRRHDYLVTQMGGLHRSVATTLLNAHPIVTRSDADAYISRLTRVKGLMQQLVEQLELQEKAGVKPPRFVYALTIGEATNLVKGQPFDETGADSPLFADFKTKLSGLRLPQADHDAYLRRARKALLEGFQPGYTALIEHLKAAEKTATDDAGAWKLPNGDGWYRFSLESYTTLPQSPQVLHELGVREVERIQTEMRAIMQKVGFAGSLQDFYAHLRDDPQFYYEDSDAGRAQYVSDAQALLDEVRRRQDEVLGLKPKIDVEVRPVEAWRAHSAAKAFYSGPPPDGSRPGIFYINLYDMKAAPKYQLAAILYHEAIPGHHVETVVAYELPDLPKFRKFASVAAFSEGWGLYSERLAREMGLYRDPYQDFGRLSLALMRATRLVVDTGIHSMKWTRAQAIDYLDATLPSSHYDNQREVERYIVIPGQATAYMVGMLKIVELRERARARLGSRFELRAFHDVVLGNGPLPLPVLEELVDAWLSGQHTS